MKETSKQRFVVIVNRILACAIILVLGYVGMGMLAGLKKPPALAEVKERALRVEAVQIVPEDVPVTITGFGEVQALNVVTLAAEVSGRVVEVHPRLEMGEVIPAGEVLFRIDPRDYKARFLDAEARVDALKNSVKRLEKQFAIDKERMETLRRSEELAKKEYLRLKRLLEEDQVGTSSGVDAAERNYNAAADQADQLDQALALYPIRIQETKDSLSSAQANRDLAQTNLDRCEVKVPFRARVKEVNVEAGQYVSPGVSVVTLADDSILEIHVPLDSRDSREWLQFNSKSPTDDAAWFSGLKKVPCKIRWTEAPDQHVWTGLLDRVVKFEQDTRTLQVAIRIEADRAASNGNGGLPLVEGMFCQVEIPGKTMKGVFRLPHWAVSYENTVYTAVDNRLVTMPVQTARTQNEYTFVSGGLKAGDLVITTRLADPLEKSLLDITLTNQEGDQS